MLCVHFYGYDTPIAPEIPDVQLFECANERRSLVSTSSLTCIVSQLNGIELYLLILDSFQTPAHRSVVVRVVAALIHLSPSIMSWYYTEFFVI